MPVKWTPETDQILLLKILETSEVSLKCVEIAEKWPTGQERPTPRAISERIAKIRSTAKASGTTSHFSISSVKSKGGTPRKNSANVKVKKATSKKANGAKAGAGKRKRGGRIGEEESSDDSEVDDFKSDNNGSEASDDETPKKKPKTNSIAMGKGKDPVKLEIEEAENGTFRDSGCEDPFGGDGLTEAADYA